MRIVVSDVAAQMGGAIQILNGLYNYILENDKENEWIFLLSKPYLEAKENVKVIVYDKVKKSPLHRVMYDLFEGRRLEKKLKPDLFFSLQNNLFKGVKTPQAVYMQQSLPFQDIVKFSPLKRSELKSWYYQVIVGNSIKKSLPKAKRIVVQTNWIKEAVCKKCNIEPDIVKVVTPKVVPVKKDGSISWDSGRFFSPITEVTYKNIACINGASEILNRNGYDEKYEVDVTFEGSSAHKNINHTGFLKRDELDRRYQVSTLIFPSYIETFGLPMAEAKTAGTVILASDCPFSHEILDDYENAYFFDPFKPEELADLMKKVVDGVIVKKKTIFKPEDVDSWGEIVEYITNLQN